MKQRDVFFNELLKYALKDPTIVLLYGDVGGAFLDRWLLDVPKRTINTGPAEQAMITCAAGLAQAGMKPYCFSIIPFLIFRPYEAIQIYLGYQRLPVRLVGVGADDSYKDVGFTHWCRNDWEAVKRAGIEVRNCSTEFTSSEDNIKNEVKISVNCLGPLYIRLLR